MLFIELPAFARQDLFDDDGLRAVQLRLLEDAEAGDLIPGGRGLRKLRAALPGRGKRGGAAGDLLLASLARLVLPGLCLREGRAGRPDPGAGPRWPHLCERY